MSKPRSKLINYRRIVCREVRGFSTEVHFGKQSKHFPDSEEYIPGRSMVTVDIEELQRLVSSKAGTGVWRGRNKDVLEFSKEIGIWVDQVSGMGIPTTRGVLHYSKTGVHVVPSKPNGSNNVL